MRDHDLGGGQAINMGDGVNPTDGITKRQMEAGMDAMRASVLDSFEEEDVEALAAVEQERLDRIADIEAEASTRAALGVTLNTAITAAIALIGKYFYNGTQRVAPCFHACKANLSVAGQIIFYLTNNGLSTGTATFSAIDQVNIEVPGFTGKDWSASVDLKTLTVNLTRQSFNGITVVGIPVLGSFTVINAPTGIQVAVLVSGAGV